MLDNEEVAIAAAIATSLKDAQQEQRYGASSTDYEVDEAEDEEEDEEDEKNVNQKGDVSSDISMAHSR